MIPGIAWPVTSWPARAWPEHAWPQDARSYLIYRRPTRDEPAGGDVAVAELEPDTASVIVEGDPDSEAWYYPRAVSRLGREDVEPIEPKLRRIAFDAAGNLILPTPNSPIDLVLVPQADGGMLARWVYESLHEAAAPDVFNVYVATGATPIDFDAPAHQVQAGNRRRYQQDLGVFADETLVRVVVRAVAASGAEEDNESEAEATADAQAPAVPNGLQTEAMTQ